MLTARKGTTDYTSSLKCSNRSVGLPAACQVSKRAEYISIDVLSCTYTSNYVSNSLIINDVLHEELHSFLSAIMYIRVKKI